MFSSNSFHQNWFKLLFKLSTCKNCEIIIRPKKEEKKWKERFLECGTKFDDIFVSVLKKFWTKNVSTKVTCLLSFISKEFDCFSKFQSSLVIIIRLESEKFNRLELDARDHPIHLQHYRNYRSLGFPSWCLSWALS